MPTERRIVLALFAIALGLRVLYGAVLATQPELGAGVATSDLIHAKEIASGIRWLGEPFSPRAPGYPIVLAGLYLLSFKQLWLVVFWQAVLGALTVVVVYRLGRLFLGVGLATIAALWFALHVYHMHLSYEFERDVVAVLLFMLVLFLVVRPFKRMKYAVVAALVYTALIHVDPQYLLLLPLLVVFVLFKTRHGVLNIQYLLLFLSVSVLASMPWTLRNNAVYGQPFPIALEAARFLRPAKVAVTEPGREIADIQKKVVRASRARLIQINSSEFWRVARFRAEEAPEAVEPPSAVNLPPAAETPSAAGSPSAGGASSPPGSPSADGTDRFLEPAWSARHNAVSIFNTGVMLPFFIVGIVAAVRQRQRAALMLAAVVLVYFLMRAYLGGSERARLPIDPLLILLAFYGIGAIVARLKQRSPAPH